MKLGFVISMYDEIDTVKETIQNLRKFDSKIIVIQSDPGDEKMILDESFCDKYEKMSDVSGGRENYQKVIKEKKEGKTELIGPLSLTRNYSKGFTLMQNFDVDYVIAITGDTKIINLKGITKIIENMKKQGKVVGGTRNIGYRMHDEFGELTQFQHKNITNIMPQFFLANTDAVKNGLFCNTKRTNKFNTEQCFGDEIVRYCKENNLKFFDVFYRICDYGYPQYIEGLYYNPEQISKMSPKMEKIMGWIRYRSSKKVNDLFTKLFRRIEGRIKSEI